MSRVPQSRFVPVVMVLLSTLAACSVMPQSSSRDEHTQPATEQVMRTQALVQSMADDYISSLGEAVFLARSPDQSPKARWLATSFLRNGAGSAIDIASSPNPAVAVLDLLVLASLQTWSFEKHWVPAGIGEGGALTLARLKETESRLWNSAKTVLSDQQLSTLRDLIEAWKADNPDRTVVSLVRFDDFADERKLSWSSRRRQASGLLKEVGEATGAIDDARLLGERLIWFAGRYPYVLGQQTELTLYRMADQPESRQLVDTLKSVDSLAQSLSARLDSLQADIRDRQSMFFEQVSSERKAAIEQSRDALQQTAREAIKDASDRISTERHNAIDELFQSVSKERTRLLDDIEARQGELRGVMVELRDTIGSSGALAKELTKTIDSIDRIVARFDAESNPRPDALHLSDVRDAAAEAKLAAEQVTRLLELTNELVASDAWEKRVANMAAPANAVIDRAFWRGLVLIVVLVGGLAATRFIPVRTRAVAVAA